MNEAFARLVDDAAIFPPGDAPLAEATAAYSSRGGDAADLVGTFVLRDTDLPLVRGFGAPLSVVVTGGAGQLAGPVGLCAKLGLHLAGVEIALRDLDDLPGNARRVTAAAAELDVPLYVELPDVGGSPSWLSAADEVAASGYRLKFRTLGLAADTLATWIDAALDRETPFKCTAGLHHAVRHDDGHGFLNVLVATRLLFDGSTVPHAVDMLEERDSDVVVRELLTAPHHARRWFTSFGSCSVAEPLADLQQLGLLDD